MLPKFLGRIVSAAILIAGGFGASLALAEGPVGQWYKTCEGQDCVRYQTRDGDLNSFELQPYQDGPLAITRLSPDADLAFGAMLQIDGQKQIRVPYRTCQNGTCQMQLVVNDSFIDSLRRGSVLRIGAYRGGKWEFVRISLTGFTAAYDGN